MMTSPHIREITHFHLFCGLGGGAKGFNRGKARVGNMEAKFRCLGGIDVDPASIADFTRLAGVQGTVLDMFSREQYTAFHGHEPPAHWIEATPLDIQMAAGGERPNIVFLSAPCKGFSGLLSETRSKTGKYQALNGLTLRGVWLMLEAWKNDPPELIVFENVPRIANRGRYLLDQIVALLRAYGYAVAETTHDCGELGGLAQSRKRFLLVARHMEKVPPFLYEPEKRSLRAVGDILGRMPLPGDLRAGPMHRVPSLQWKTWVRLAFVEAGSDWRSLNKLRVNDGKLADYLLVPEYRAHYLGVNRWDEATGTISSRGGPSNGNFSVADPRMDGLRPGPLGVCDWDTNARTIAGESFPTNGNFSVADPRFDQSTKWNDGQAYGVRKWSEPTGTIAAQQAPGQGPYSVADPRLSGLRHSNVFRIMKWEQHSQAVTGGQSPTAGGLGIADPRPQWEKRYGNLHVADWREPSKTVIAGGKGVQGGWLSIADPRYKGETMGTHTNKMRVVDWDNSMPTVTGSDRVGSGALSVADPRCIHREKGDNYLTGGHYGVVPWDSPTGAVSSSAGCDNGRWSVADPRMPEQDEKIVAVIRALDGTWHRPFTTMELAALQSLMDPEETLELDGLSDSAWRERISNSGFGYQGPQLILAQLSSATPAALIEGDSLAVGFGGDTPDSFGNVGAIARSLTNVMPWVQSARGSTTCAQAQARDNGSFAVSATGITDIFLAYGRNDIMASGSSSATAISCLQSVAAKYLAMGKRVWVFTIPPTTSSQDLWATTANQFFATACSPAASTYSSTTTAIAVSSGSGMSTGQLVALQSGATGVIPIGTTVTVSGNNLTLSQGLSGTLNSGTQICTGSATLTGAETQRRAFNTAMRNGGAVSSGFTGLIDWAAQVESGGSASPNGLWVANYTGDGVHQNATGHGAIVSSGILSPNNFPFPSR